MSTRPLPQHKSILDIAPYVGGKSSVAGAKQVIKLSSNETPLGASPKAIDALRDFDALHRYPDGGCTTLRNAIAEVHGLPAERIVCGAGSDELIGLLIHAYAGNGGEVLYSEHGFLMYKIYAQSFGAIPVTAPETGLRTDVDALLAAVTPRTKIVFVANPNNPTGSYITGKELKRLRDGLPAHVILGVDSAYAEYVSDLDYSNGEALVDATDNTVMFRTFSKIYGLAALRVGWAYAPEGIADILNRVRSPFNVSSVAQVAGIAAVRDQAHIKKALAHNDTCLKSLPPKLSTLGLTVYPSVGNFLLIGFPEGKHCAENANDFLLKRGVILRAVGNYGLPHCLRATIGLDAENKALLEALTEFMA